jgi:uncharacterized protein (DUF2249 family)/iron-sulfur cluster repair protein YtfE (RIC family)
MTPVRDAIHNHHQELLDTLTKYTVQLSGQPSPADAAALAGFLQQDLLPHAHGEEKYLYPAVDGLIKAHGQATATMSVDHEFIEGYVAQITATAVDLNDGDARTRAAAAKQLERLMIQLDALLRVHLEKEERIYLPLFEQYLPLEEQQRILDGMHEPISPAVKTTLDLRQLPPPQRHPLVFQTFDALQPGETFQLINDHDPKPLYYQFKFERDGEFTWDSVEAGPLAWRVNIAKTAKAHVEK